MTRTEDRRRYQRVKLLQQVRGRIGEVRVFLSDASTKGVRVVHRETLAKPGSNCSLEFTWEGQLVAVEGVLRHTTVKRAAKSALEHSLYESGLEIVSVMGEGAAVLRQMIEWHVLRALDEQKANARGLPAIAAQSFQTGKTEQLVRHELVKGVWRDTSTTEPWQPPNGFTISSEETWANIQMLRATYASGDQATREMIRQTSAMSISKVEGIPTRRYEP